MLTLNWAAWVLISYTALGFFVGLVRLLATGRKAYSPPDSAVEAVVRLVVFVGLYGVWVWLFLTAVRFI
jgi:hypothetical protein